ncbi:MAG: caspase family protein, partial [Cytophagales bacterium]|nr:caspase family protein [Cytophagales bacterium]
MMTARCLFYASLLLAPWQWGQTPRQPLAQGLRTKRALIIAIGAYQPDVTGWQPLSARNDVPLVKGALARHGFAGANVAVLTDEDCTKAGIVAAIERHLIAAARPGDVVFLHFTGHGQQIVDDNEEETDGFDEALIPIDAPYNYRKKGYRGENHLRDDEFGNLLDRIRRKVGATGEVIFTVDACHSGSITRGDGLEDSDAEAEPSGYIEMPALPDAQAGLAPFVVFS